MRELIEAALFSLSRGNIDETREHLQGALVLLDQQPGPAPEPLDSIGE